MSKSWKSVEYKIVLLGDSLVGKSSIFERLSGQAFTESNIATIGTEKQNLLFDDLEINIDDKKYKKNFTVSLFDTAGQERYRAITKNYYKGSNGIMLIYDITDIKTFEHVTNWLDGIKQVISDWKNANYVVMLIGNKLDLAKSMPETRKITVEESKKFCVEQDIFYGGECSAKTMFVDVLKKIFERLVREIFIKENKNINNNSNNSNENNNNKVNLDKKGQKKKKKKCC